MIVKGTIKIDEEEGKGKGEGQERRRRWERRKERRLVERGKGR